MKTQVKQQQPTPEHKILTREAFGAIVTKAAEKYGMTLGPNFEPGTSGSACAYTEADYWDSDATVSVSDRYVESNTIDDDNVEYLSRIHVSINWASMVRTVAQSVYALASYQRALNFAAEVEAKTAGKFFVMTKDMYK